MRRAVLAEQYWTDYNDLTQHVWHTRQTRNRKYTYAFRDFCWLIMTIIYVSLHLIFTDNFIDSITMWNSVANGNNTLSYPFIANFFFLCHPSQLNKFDFFIIIFFFMSILRIEVLNNNLKLKIEKKTFGDFNLIKPNWLVEPTIIPGLRVTVAQAPLSRLCVQQFKNNGDSPNTFYKTVLLPVEIIVRFI